MLINNEGLYRAKSIAEMVMDDTKKGRPQAIMQLQAEEIYDEDTKEWVPISECGADVGTDTRAYLCLVGKNGRTPSFEQVQKITGWDGCSFPAINQINVSEAGIQFRVKLSVFEEKESYKVEWVDTYDATPSGSSLQGLDDAGLKALDVRFKDFLKPKNVTPAKAPTATAPPVPGKRTRRTKAEMKAAEAAATEAAIGSPVDEGILSPTISLTHEEAWAKCEASKPADVTADVLAEMWLEACEKIAGEVTDEATTGEQWAEIANAVIAKL